MDIEQYQPSPKMLELANTFCAFFGRQPLYYSYDLGNRVVPVNYMQGAAANIQLGGSWSYRQVAERIATSHQVEQLTIVVEEALRCFPQYAYNSDQICGLIGGICGGRVLKVGLAGVEYRAIVLTAGVVWLDKIPRSVLDPDNVNWTIVSRAIETNRKHILRERELLKNLFRQ